MRKGGALSAALATWKSIFFRRLVVSSYHHSAALLHFSTFRVKLTPPPPPPSGQNISGKPSVNKRVFYGEPWSHRFTIQCTVGLTHKIPKIQERTSCNCRESPAWYSREVVWVMYSVLRDEKMKETKWAEISKSLSDSPHSCVAYTTNRLCLHNNNVSMQTQSAEWVRTGLTIR